MLHSPPATDGEQFEPPPIRNAILTYILNRKQFEPQIRNAIRTYFLNWTYEARLQKIAEDYSNSTGNETWGRDFGFQYFRGKSESNLFSMTQFWVFLRTFWAKLTLDGSVSAVFEGILHKTYVRWLSSECFCGILYKTDLRWLSFECFCGNFVQNQFSMNRIWTFLQGPYLFLKTRFSVFRLKFCPNFRRLSFENFWTIVSQNWFSMDQIWGFSQKFC